MRLYLFLRFLRKKDTCYVIIISPIQPLVSTPGVWFHVLYDVLRRHNRDRYEAIEGIKLCLITLLHRVFPKMGRKGSAFFIYANKKRKIARKSDFSLALALTISPAGELGHRQPLRGSRGTPSWS